MDQFRDNDIHFATPSSTPYKCHTRLHRSRNQEPSLRASVDPGNGQVAYSAVYTVHRVVIYTCITQLHLYTSHTPLYAHTATGRTHHSLVPPQKSSPFHPTSAAQAPSVGNLKLGIGRMQKELLLFPSLRPRSSKRPID